MIDVHQTALLVQVAIGISSLAGLIGTPIAWHNAADDKTETSFYAALCLTVTTVASLFALIAISCIEAVTRLAD